MSRKHAGEVKATMLTPRKQTFTPAELVVGAQTSDELIITGLYQNHITIGEDDDGVFSGAGCGNPWIMFKWKGKHGKLHAIDLLAAWVKTLGPEGEKDAQRLLDSK